MGDYTDALAKDLKRIEAELKQIDAALKKNPNDAAALKKKKAVLPFLEEKSLQKRFDNARANAGPAGMRTRMFGGVRTASRTRRAPPVARS